MLVEQQGLEHRSQLQRVLYLPQQIVIRSLIASDTMPSPSLPHCTRNRDTFPQKFSLHADFGQSLPSRFCAPFCAPMLVCDNASSLLCRGLLAVLDVLRQRGNTL